MRAFFALLAFVLMVCTFSPTAFCGIGIGAAFPLGGGQSSSSGETANYASFSGPEFIAESSVWEKSGALTMELRLTNPAEHPFAIEHRDGQSFDFVLYDEKGKELYRWSEGVAFEQALRTEEIQAKGSVTYSATIAKKDYRKIKDKVVLLKMYLTDTPYVFSLVVPKRTSSSGGSSPYIYGGIGIGRHGW